MNRKKCDLWKLCEIETKWLFFIRFDFKVNDDEINKVEETFGGDLTLPENFEPTGPTLHDESTKDVPQDHVRYVFKLYSYQV